MKLNFIIEFFAFQSKNINPVIDVIQMKNFLSFSWRNSTVSKCIAKKKTANEFVVLDKMQLNFELKWLMWLQRKKKCQEKNNMPFACVHLYAM